MTFGKSLVGALTRLLNKKLTLVSAAVFALIPLLGITQVEAVSYQDGNAKDGKAASSVCAACHGVDGNSASSAFPKLAGQSARYLFKQLMDMKSGVRPVSMMASPLNGLTEQKMADLAAFYAEQKATIGNVDKELVELGESIYRGGLADRGIPACAACHGPAGEGVPSAGYPSLSGQHAAYTEAQLVAFRAAARGDNVGAEKKRANDGDSMIMRTAAKLLSDEEIKAVSSYVSGLH